VWCEALFALNHERQSSFLRVTHSCTTHVTNLNCYLLEQLSLFQPYYNNAESLERQLVLHHFCVARNSIHAGPDHNLGKCPTVFIGQKQLANFQLLLAKATMSAPTLESVSQTCPFSKMFSEKSLYFLTSLLKS